MKKIVVTILIAVVAVAAIAGAGVVYAQGNGPGNGTSNGNGTNGTGGFGAAGGQAMGPAMRGDAPGIGGGILHDGIIAYFADALNLDVTDLQARLDAGETMADIAVSEGLTLDEFQTLKVEARDAAIAQAVADGTLTQAQADLMKQGGFGRMGGGYGRGMRGAGQGQYANPDCPMFDNVQP
jgi:opacity protein-like surface antigen